MATPFAAACDVAISNDYGTVGTFTKAQLSTPTPEEWKASFTDGTYWNEMTPYLKTQFMMRACGLTRQTFYDWIMSSNLPGQGALATIHKMQRGPSIIQPFIMGRQVSPVNNEDWVITNGWAVASYTAGSTGPLTSAQLTASPGTSTSAPYRVIRVIAGYANDSLPLDARYFLPQHVLHIFSLALSPTTALHGQWKIIAAAVNTSATFIDVVIQDQMNDNDDTGYTAESTPVNGIAVIGINNINDYETYCQNRLAVNPIKHVPFWYQTYRNCRRVSSSYMEMFGRLMADNAYYDAFVGLPLSEYNRQDELMAQREFAISFLFQDKINIKQRLSGNPNWGDLDNILSVTGATIDPGTGSELIAKRANMIGVLPQLKACGSQYEDWNGATIDVKTWLETNIFNLHRQRKSSGVKSANQIDVRMNSVLADQFQMAFVKYSNWKLDDSVRIVIEQGDTIGVQWNRFKLYKPMGVWLNVIAETFLDDLSNSFDQLAVSGTPAFTGAQATARGNMALTLDLGKGGTIYPILLDSNRTEVTTGELANLAKVDSTFACVMKNPTIKTNCTSSTVTAAVECPLLSRWDEDFSDFSFTAP